LERKRETERERDENLYATEKRNDIPRIPYSITGARGGKRVRRRRLKKKRRKKRKKKKKREKKPLPLPLFDVEKKNLSPSLPIEKKLLLLQAFYSSHERSTPRPHRASPLKTQSSPACSHRSSRKGSHPLALGFKKRSRTFSVHRPRGASSFFDDAKRLHILRFAARPFMAKRGRRNNLNVKIYYPLLLLCYLEVRARGPERERRRDDKRSPTFFFFDVDVDERRCRILMALF